VIFQFIERPFETFATEVKLLTRRVHVQMNVETRRQLAQFSRILIEHPNEPETPASQGGSGPFPMSKRASGGVTGKSENEVSTALEVR
jgi:hypothetical protein